MHGSSLRHSTHHLTGEKGDARWVRRICFRPQVVPRFEESNVKSYEQRQKEEQATVLFGLVERAALMLLELLDQAE